MHGVDSNDTLYGGTEAYMEELQGIVNSLVGEVVADIEALAEGSMRSDLLIMLSDALFTYFEEKKMVGKLLKKAEAGAGAKHTKWLARLKSAIQGDQ